MECSALGNASVHFQLDERTATHRHTQTQAQEGDTQEHGPYEEHEGRKETRGGLAAGAGHLPPKESGLIKHYVLLKGVVVLLVVGHGYPPPELTVNGGVCACVFICV